MGERPHTRCCVTHAQHSTKHSTPVTSEVTSEEEGGRETCLVYSQRLKLHIVVQKWILTYVI